MQVGGIDQPLGLIRREYSYDFPDPVLIVPHANWRGAYETSTFVDGNADRCKTVWLPSSEVVRRDSTGRVYTLPLDAPDTTQARCIERDFPGAYMGMTRLLKRQTVYGPNAWQGSLVMDGSDASGLSYRRNRYYDPSTGRFTQEDPIGIAGGLNVYGFAGGDPLNYSDPYGLCPPRDFDTSDCTRVVLGALMEAASAATDVLADWIPGARNITLAAFGNLYGKTRTQRAAALAAAALEVGSLGEGSAGRGGAQRVGTGLRGASPGLMALFSEGGGLAERTLIGVRTALRGDGFSMRVSENGAGYLFTNAAGEEVRMMRGKPRMVSSRAERVWQLPRSSR